MVYAMMSIGLLGFQVWSFFFLQGGEQVALLHINMEIINFAICWNSSTLLSTLNSKNLSNYTQSAGNCKVPSTTSPSETTRKTSYDLFSSFRILYKNQGYVKQISDQWLEWFIGFAEGDGAILSYNGRPRFIITQKESAILNHIKSTLGFGIIRQSGNYYRYIVVDEKEILVLTNVFNGNLVLKHRVNQLQQWIIDLNAKMTLSRSSLYNLTPIILISTRVEPSLNSSWLSGFTDAEGCFNVNITKRKNTVTGYRVQLRFILDQKNAREFLIEIRNLFGYGNVILRSGTNEVYRYYCDTFIGFTKVNRYFSNHPLKSKKSLSYENWCKVYTMVISKEHLVVEGLEKIRQITKTINVNNSHLIKTGSAKNKT